MATTTSTDAGQGRKLISMSSVLTAEQYEVVTMRYSHGLTQDETAAAIEASQATVHRIEQAALATLRQYGNILLDFPE